MHAFCFMNMLFTHAFCICFYSIMLFITLFFIFRMKYEQEVGCGEQGGNAFCGGCDGADEG